MEVRRAKCARAWMMHSRGRMEIRLNIGQTNAVKIRHKSGGAAAAPRRAPLESKRVPRMLRACTTHVPGLHLSIPSHAHGLYLALWELCGSFVGALWKLWGSFGVALGWLWGRNRFPISWLWGGFDVALGGFGLEGGLERASWSTFCLLPSSAGVLCRKLRHSSSLSSLANGFPGEVGWDAGYDAIGRPSHSAICGS